VLDVDLVAKAVRHTRAHTNLEAWQDFFSSGRYTVEAAPGGLRCIFTADPENIKAILATQFTDYGKGEPFHEDWKEFLGDSIFTTDLDQWHTSRQLIRPQFIKDRVSDLDVFEEHVQILMQQIRNAGQGAEIDVSDLFFRYTLDAATHFLLGRSVRSLELGEQEFANGFNEVQRVQNIIARAGYVPFPSTCRNSVQVLMIRVGENRPLKWLVPMKTFRAGIKTINEFVAPYIDEALRLSPEELATKTKSEEGYTFLHALASFTRDRTVLRDQLVAVLLAGRDTTASTLSWTFYELARHPEVVERLRKEIIEHVGLERAPTYTDLKNMKYLQVCLPLSLSYLCFLASSSIPFYSSHMLAVALSCACHLRIERVNLTNTEHNERNPPPLPRRPLQRAPRPKKHHPPARRRSRRPLPHRRAEKHAHRLQHARHATTSRPIPPLHFPPRV
jgi:cytochrome P450